MLRIFLILGLSALATRALHLPEYIKPCSRSSGDFNKCALEHAKEALPYVIKGDKRYKVPSLNPLKISLINLKGINNFHINMKNVEVYGLDGIVPIEFNVDFDKQHASTLSTAPRIFITGEYNMTGKLIFPINGFGHCNITLHEGIYKYEFDWILEERNNDTYAKIVKSYYDYELQKVTYQFENLFNGDKVISDQLNMVLNDNWKEVDRDLQNSVKATLLKIQNSILEHLYTTIPYKEIFVD